MTSTSRMVVSTSSTLMPKKAATGVLSRARIWLRACSSMERVSSGRLRMSFWVTALWLRSGSGSSRCSRSTISTFTATANSPPSSKSSKKLRKMRWGRLISLQWMWKTRCSRRQGGKAAKAKHRSRWLVASILMPRLWSRWISTGLRSMIRMVIWIWRGLSWIGKGALRIVLIGYI